MRALLAYILATASGCCVFSAAPYRGPRSDHFDGERFFNPIPGHRERGLPDVLKLLATRDPTKWPEHVEVEAQPPPPARVGPGELRATFVNHATVLIQMDGVNVLTDPIWSERASPVSFAGPRRVHRPGVRIEDLPRIHLVLVSHSHYDHLDVDTLQALWRRDQPRVVVALGTSPIVRAAGVPKVRELDWWQGFVDTTGLRITSVPVVHFANRGACDAARQLWTGFVIEGPQAGRVYFAGDTATGPHFAAARERFGDFRLALLPIGAYRPEWFMSYVHMDPREAVEAHRALGAQTSLGIHFGTFQLTDEGRDEPIADLADALGAAAVPADTFWTLAPGEGRDVPPTPQAPRTTGAQRSRRHSDSTSPTTATPRASAPPLAGWARPLERGACP